MDQFRRLPPDGKRDPRLDRDALPVMSARPEAKTRFYTEYHQYVQELADTRYCQYRRQAEERERVSAAIVQQLVELKKCDFLDAMRRLQLHKNSPDIQSLNREVERAKTTLNLLEKRSDNIEARKSERQMERQLALAEVELIQREKIAKEEAQLKKNSEFDEQLLAQIQVRAAQRERDALAVVQEGARMRLEYEEVAKMEDIVEEQRRNRERLHKIMIENLELMREKHELDAKKTDTVDVMVLDTLGPVTLKALRKEQQNRVDSIERRHQVSNNLGQKVAADTDKRQNRFKTLLDVLIAEHVVSQERQRLDEIQKQHDQKQEMATKLISQLKEQEIQKIRDSVINRVVRDDTSFMERQYQQSAAKEAIVRDMNERCRQEVDSQVYAYEQFRKSAKVEELQMFKKRAAMEADLNRRVYEERMRILHAQDSTVIKELRPCALTKAERKAFGLPACGINDVDVSKN